MMMITIEELMTSRLGTLSFLVHFVANLAMIPWDICFKNGCTFFLNTQVLMKQLYRTLAIKLIAWWAALFC